MQPTELLKQGQLLRRQDRAEAIACFEESIQRAESINDEMLISNALTELAIELIEIGQTPALGRAKSLLERSMYLLHKLDTQLDTPKLDGNLDRDQTQQKKNYIIYAQGLLSLQEGNFREAIAQFDRVYTSYGNDAEMQVNLDYNLAESYIAIGDFKTSLSYLERSTPILSSLNKGSNYEQLGRIYLHLDRYARAKDYFEQSLDIALETEDKYLRVRAFIGLSQVAIAEQEWENAINVINEVLLQLEEPLDLQEAAYLYLNLAEAKIGMGNIVEAQEDVEDRAIPRFEKLQNQYGLASAKRTFAIVLANRLAKGINDITEERIEAIADEFLDALMMFDIYGTPQDKAKTLYDLAYFYTQFNEPRYKYQFHGKAVRSLEQALIGLEPFKDDSPALFAKVEQFLDKLLGDFGLF